MRRHDEANRDDLEMSLPFHTLVAASLQRRGKILSEIRRAVGAARAAERGVGARQELSPARGSRQAAARRGRGRGVGARRGLDVGRRRASQLALCAERRLVKLDLEAEIELYALNFIKIWVFFGVFYEKERGVAVPPSASRETPRHTTKLVMKRAT